MARRLLRTRPPSSSLSRVTLSMGSFLPSAQVRAESLRLSPGGAPCITREVSYHSEASPMLSLLPHNCSYQAGCCQGQEKKVSGSHWVLKRENLGCITHSYVSWLLLLISLIHLFRSEFSRRYQK